VALDWIIKFVIQDFPRSTGLLCGCRAARWRVVPFGSLWCQIEGASGALVFPGLVEDEILRCVNWSVALYPWAGVRLLG